MEMSKLEFLIVSLMDPYQRRLSARNALLEGTIIVLGRLHVNTSQ